VALDLCRPIILRNAQAAVIRGVSRDLVTQQRGGRPPGRGIRAALREKGELEDKAAELAELADFKEIVAELRERITDLESCVALEDKEKEKAAREGKSATGSGSGSGSADEPFKSSLGDLPLKELFSAMFAQAEAAPCAGSLWQPAVPAAGASESKLAAPAALPSPFASLIVDSSPTPAFNSGVGPAVHGETGVTTLAVKRKARPTATPSAKADEHVAKKLKT